MKYLIDGIIKAKTHLYYIRVHYEDTDIGGIVYHAKYINFIERARTSLIRLIKFPAEKFLKNGLSIVVKSINFDWNSSSTLGDCICVETNILKIRKVSIILRQTIYNFERSKILATAEVKICFLDTDMKIALIPNEFIKKLKINFA